MKAFPLTLAMLRQWMAAAGGNALCQIPVAVAELRESAYGYKETSSGPNSTSALPPKTDILVAVTDFRF